MRMRDTGRSVFNRRTLNPHGPVLDMQRMKSWFSATKAKQGKNYIHPREAYWRACKIAELHERVVGNTVGIKKKVLASRMAESDKRAGYIVGLLEQGYVDPPPLL